MVNVQTILYLCAKCHNFPACGSMGCTDSTVEVEEDEESDLCFRDGHCVFKHDPLHVLGAGRRGERAVVHEVFFDGLWKQSQQRKRFQRVAFTFKTSMFVFLLLQFEIMKSFVDVILKKRIYQTGSRCLPLQWWLHSPGCLQCWPKKQTKLGSLW